MEEALEPAAAPRELDRPTGEQKAASLAVVVKRTRVIKPVTIVAIIVITKIIRLTVYT